MDEDILIKAENISKKFSKNLRRSMIYGTSELVSNLIGRKPQTTRLRSREFWAVDHVDLEVKRGQVVGIIGHNGCGKTTLLRLIAGIYPPDDGKITVKGTTAALISLGVGFHPLMTGYENIYLNGTLLGMKKDEIDSKIDQIIEFAEIGDFINTPTANYSSGMRVRLGFSIAIAIDPDVLLLDEILAVGDRTFKAKSYKKIESLSKQTASILISHNMQMVSRICTEIIVMEKGKFIFKSSDVAAGTEYYQALNSVSEKDESGTGLIELQDIQLSNMNSSEKGHWVQLHAEDPLEVDFTVKVSEPEKMIGARILLFDNEFNVIGEAFSNSILFSGENQKDGKHSEEKTINVRFPKVLLKSGGYSLSLVFIDFSTNKSIKSFHAVGNLQVLDNKLARAAVALETEWTVQEGAHEGS